MWILRHLAFLPLLSAVTFLQAPVEAEIPSAEAKAVFATADELCRADAGKLWGRSLCSPMLLIDSSTRDVVGSEPDADGRLARDREDALRGRLEVDVPAANTSLTWAGVRWTAVLWPLPEAPARRRQLLAHEMFHRVQSELGLPSNNPASAHLAGYEGRRWMRLEFRALAAAVKGSGEERRRAALDALAFRAERASLAADAGANESALEANEGLAQYTGARLASRDDRTASDLALADLAEAEAQPSFARSFAYGTGPAYGLLLDDLARGWRSGIAKRPDLAAALRDALETNRGAGAKPVILASGARERAARYGDAAISREEKARAEVHDRRVADFRARLVAGPVLALPFEKMQISFDPDEVEPLGDDGTVYPKGRIADRWGVLTVEGGGMLVDARWSGVRLGASALEVGTTVRGGGWTLDLAQGWEIVPGSPAGSWTVRERKP